MPSVKHKDGAGEFLQLFWKTNIFIYSLPKKRLCLAPWTYKCLFELYTDFPYAFNRLTFVCYANNKCVNIANSSSSPSQISRLNLIPAHSVYKRHGPAWKEAAGPKLESYENTWSSSKCWPETVVAKCAVIFFFFLKNLPKVDITSGPD